MIIIIRIITVLSANLRLGNDELGGIGVVGTSERVLQNANSSEDVADNLGLVGEVGRVTENHLGLGLELHLLNTSHGRLDAHSLVALILDLVDVGVEHVSTAVDGRQTGETLGKLAKTVERVDVRRLSVSSNRVTVQADSLDGLGSLAGGGDVVVGEVESHGVTNEVLCGGLEAELVIDILHGALVDVQA
jgi:hypothetical protein